jgi:hypothetical protein
MKKLLSLVFLYAVVKSMLDNYTESVGKHIAMHLYKLIDADKTNLYCPICSEPLALEKFDALVADVDPECKIHIYMHSACLYKMGLDVCGDCRKIVKADNVNNYHVCGECLKTKK